MQNPLQNALFLAMDEQPADSPPAGPQEQIAKFKPDVTPYLRAVGRSKKRRIR
jgi:hypothetical protein